MDMVVNLVNIIGVKDSKDGERKDFLASIGPWPGRGRLVSHLPYYQWGGALDFPRGERM